jgi:glycolate oxidase iron-sulfur subunit
LLNKAGCEVVLANKVGCCGALVNHLGRRDDAKAFAKVNIKSWNDEIEGDGLDAIIINASGCGTEVKGYSNLLKNEVDWRDRAERISSITKDISEFLYETGIPGKETSQNCTVLYHDACSLVHGQKVKLEPRSLLEDVGFDVKEIPGKHFCCGSAGTYNLIEKEISEQLKLRRCEAIERIDGEFVATGNIGCQVQLQTSLKRPVVHTVELLDWATGGPRPPSN